jgi:hypothetical protein
MYYFVFYRFRLVPRWLTLWGIAGELTLFDAGQLALYNGTDVTSYTFLALPIFMQEIALAVWLLLRGFSAPNTKPGEVIEPRPADSAPATP